jgi:ectoine hydroxylase-related dioxygenase (phytanoyl-CoA dioxygenase family)
MTRRALTVEEQVTTAAQRRFYAEQGYLVVRGLFAKLETAEFAAEADRLLGLHELIDPNNLRCRWQPDVQTGECLFEAFDPVLDLSPMCARLAHDPRLLEVLASLCGEEPCLFKDKLIFKPPGARGYDLHQDYIAFPGFPRSFVTVLVPIDPCVECNGCLEVFPGGHLGGCLSAEDGNYHTLPLEAVAQYKGMRLELMPGDVAIFGCFLPHRSAPNYSDGWRRQFYLSYNAVSDGGPQRDQHYEHFLHWLRERYAEHGKTEVHFR